MGLQGTQGEEGIVARPAAETGISSKISRIGLLKKDS